MRWLNPFYEFERVRILSKGITDYIVDIANCMMTYSVFVLGDCQREDIAEVPCCESGPRMRPPVRRGGGHAR